MPRFSLSPSSKATASDNIQSPPLSSPLDPINSKLSPRENDVDKDDDEATVSSSSVSSTTSSDNEASSYDDDDDEQEEPHPLGFQSYGLTRFSLYPPSNKKVSSTTSTTRSSPKKNTEETTPKPTSTPSNTPTPAPTPNTLKSIHSTGSQSHGTRSTNKRSYSNDNDGDMNVSSLSHCFKALFSSPKANRHRLTVTPTNRKYGASSISTRTPRSSSSSLSSGRKGTKSKSTSTSKSKSKSTKADSSPLFQSSSTGISSPSLPSSTQYMQSLAHTPTVLQHHYRSTTSHQQLSNTSILLRQIQAQAVPTKKARLGSKNDVTAATTTTTSHTTSTSTKAKTKTSTTSNPFSNFTFTSKPSTKLPFSSPSKPQTQTQTQTKIQKATNQHKQDLSQIPTQLSKIQSQRKQRQQQELQSLSNLLRQEEKEAQAIQAQEFKQEQERQEEERIRLEQERLEQERLQEQEKERKQKLEEQREKKEKAAAEVAAAQAKEAQLKQQQAEEQQKVVEQQKKEMEQQKAKKVEHVTRATKMIKNLESERAKLSSFDTSKEMPIKKRRMKIKSIAKGRLNTLCKDAEKIRQVCNDVATAIEECWKVDVECMRELKQEVKNGNTSAAEGGLMKDMTRGTRYLMDLIASTVIVRVQAEGFNGTRGDGFPLAHMLSTVSSMLTRKEEFPIYINGHLYSACPILIPTLPTPAPDLGEEELMESLGMNKDKDGKYESFDRFLARTEGLISIMAGIMSSQPPDHRLLGGQKNAIQWLTRFMDLLPPEQSPLPLLTAPALVAFLTGAGHMLANKYTDQFRPLLDTIQNDISKRLDMSPIGEPSAKRLFKLLKKGFQGFQETLPDGAVQDFYDTGNGGGSGFSTSGSNANTTGIGSTGGVSQSPFSNSTSSALGSGNAHNSTTNNPFQAGGSSGPMSSSFSTNTPTKNSFSMSNSAATNNPFSTSNTMSQQSNFAVTQSTNSTQSPFQSTGSNTFNGTTSNAPNSNQQPNPFSANTNQATNAQNNPFSGGNTSQQPSPFSTNTNQQANPFGNNNMTNTTQQQSPFSTSTNMNSGGGFQSSNAFSTSNPSSSSNAFSNSMTNTFAPASSNPFSTSNSSASSTPFSGGTSMTSTSNPFGISNNTSNMASASPFSGSGGSNMTSSTPFANNNSASTPFSTNNTANNNASTPFANNNTTNNNASTPFAISNNNSNAFVGGGGGRGKNNNQSNNRNSNSNRQNNPSMGADGKPMCKFFLKGTCRYGDRCRFSHKMPGSGGSSFGGGGGNSFANNWR